MWRFILISSVFFCLRPLFCSTPNILVIDSIMALHLDTVATSAEWRGFGFSRLIYEDRDPVLQYMNEAMRMKFDRQLFTAPQNQHTCEIINKRTYTEYLPVGDDYNRVIRINQSILVYDRKGKIVWHHDINEKYSDTISSFDYADIDSRDFPFAHAELSTQDMSTFKKVFEPVIVIVSALASVILFFTVRSK